MFTSLNFVLTLCSGTYPAAGN